MESSAEPEGEEECTELDTVGFINKVDAEDPKEEESEEGRELEEEDEEDSKGGDEILHSAASLAVFTSFSAGTTAAFAVKGVTAGFEAQLGLKQFALPQPLVN